MNKYLVVIVGPTAIGKTDLAIRVANHFSADILSADSRQFYREMSIGTAKPSRGELSQATHHFIDSLSIFDEFSVGDFEIVSLNILNEIYESKDIAVLVGGSGLYINAVTEGFDTLPKGDPAIRQQLNLLFTENGIVPLQEQLQQLDPEYYKEVDKSNPQRLIRALEVILATGVPFSSLRLKTKKKRPFKTIKIGLNTDRQELYQRIDTRVDQMVSMGLIDEVRRLLPYRNLNALQTVGYTEIFEYLDGKTSYEEAIALVKQNTRRFAKRQLTWFRRDQEITWFEPDDTGQIISYISSRLNFR